MAKLFWVAVWTAGVVWVVIALTDGKKECPVSIEAERMDDGQHPPPGSLSPPFPAGAIIFWQPVPRAKPDDRPLVRMQATEY